MQELIRRVCAGLLVLVMVFSNISIVYAAPVSPSASITSENPVRLQQAANTTKENNSSGLQLSADEESSEEDHTKDKESSDEKEGDKKEEEKEEDEDHEGDEESGEEGSSQSWEGQEKPDKEDPDSQETETSNDQETGTLDDQEKTEETEGSESTEDDSQYENNEVPWSEAVDDGRNTIPPLLKAAAVNHKVTMPDVTSHYFQLQKKSKKVSVASGAHLKVVANAKEASRYIFEEYPEGARYNFTPQFSSKSKVSTGGGQGGKVSLSTVKNGTRGRYGDIFNAVNDGAIADCAFNLSKCSNPWALYTKVGSFFDRKTGKSTDVDMRLSVAGWVYPGEATRKDLVNQEINAPYVAFTKKRIGMISHATDSIKLKMDFYYSGTTTPIKNLAGYIQGCDIDAMQGIDFGTGFEKVIMFKDSRSKLQYSGEGLTEKSIGYVSSRVVTALSTDDTSTTALGLFSGPQASLVFTLAKCDRKDTGGKAKYAAASGFGIPADTTDDVNICYRKSNSTGLLTFKSDVHLIPVPDGGHKTEYQGEIDSSKAPSGKESMVLENREAPYTYVLSCPAAQTTNVTAARYESFGFEDKLDPLLVPDEIRVFRTISSGAGQNESCVDVTNLFTIEHTPEEDHGEKIVVMAKKDQLTQASFYGCSYDLHIQARIRTDQELKDIGRSISEWYREADQEGAGNIRIENKSYFLVTTNAGSSIKKESNIVITDLACRIAVKKIDRLSGLPVAGVTFGLFGGEEVKDPKAEDALLTAVTGEDGIAVFQSTEKDAIYDKKYGDGPYVVKELSVPDEYKDIWEPAVNTDWSYIIHSLKKEAVFGEPKVDPDAIPAEATLPNNNRSLVKGAVKVYKTSAESGEDLEGAEFMLMEWSEKDRTYHDLAPLKQDKENNGDKGSRIVYRNETPLINSMDNLGRYRILETKAPRGCVLSKEAWLFQVASDSKKDGSNIIYRKENGKKKDKQTGSLTIENTLQKGRIRLVKTDDEGKPVEGAVFTITAAEDIYAPWNLDDQGQPLKGAEPLVSKGTLAAEIRTGKDGIAQTPEDHPLYIGRWTIQEKYSSGNHVKSPASYEVRMEYNEDTENPIIVYSLDVSNSTMKPSFSVAKLADKTTDENGEKVDFDKKTGRYSEKKQAGIYHGGNQVDYTIHVTNTGNVTLYNLVLIDVTDQANDRGQALAAYIKEGSGHFQMPKSGSLSTEKGKKIKLTAGDDASELCLSRLAVGDSVVLHYIVELKDDAANAYDLVNIVYGTASYDIHEDDDEEKSLKEVPVTGLVDSQGRSLVKDDDAIHVPGEGEITPTKYADRTSGIVIEDGQLASGSRIPGVYQGGETVSYSVIVKNTGTAALKKINVKDSPDKVLLDLIEADSPGFFPGEEAGTAPLETELVSKEGTTIKAKILSRDQVILCDEGETDQSEQGREQAQTDQSEQGREQAQTDQSQQDQEQNQPDQDQSAKGQEGLLMPGDYVTLTYRIRLKKSLGNLYDLANTVAVQAYYFDGITDKETPEKKDKDRIEIPGHVEGRVAKLADRTTGAVLENGRYNAEAKVSGAYVSGDTVHYKITVTNTGQANLYHLTLTDEMSPELKEALDISSVTFRQEEYKTEKGRKVRTTLEEPTVMILDFLGAGDSVNLELTGKVKKDIGNLFDLDNIIKLTASSRTGNEEEKEKYEELASGKWVKLIYHANFDQDQTRTDSETPCKAGLKVSVDGNPFDRDGWSFAGWNEKADGSGKAFLPDGVYTMPDQDADLYAQWVPSQEGEIKARPLFRLNYDSNNPKDQTETDEESPVEAGQGLSINDNHFQWEGYEFTGWNTRPNGKGDSYKAGDVFTMPAEDITIYAQWKKIPTYKLIYDANHNSGEERKDGETPTVSATGLTIDGNPFVWEDGETSYRFTGWNSRPSGEGESYQPGDSMVLYKDSRLYAQWETMEEEEGEEKDKKAYTLTYHANNGTDASSIDAQTPAHKDDQIEIDANAFRHPGYQFTGWNSKADGSGTDYLPGADYMMPGRHVNLYARWKKKDQLVLTYDSNTDEPETMTDAQTPADPDSKILIDGIFTSRDGYNFTGWNTKKDGTGTAFAPGDNFEIKENTILYAQWTKKLTKYRLTYDSNLAGQYHMTETDGETPCPGGSKINVNPNRFRVPGKIFSGWNTKKDGSGSAYQPEDALIMPDKDLTLYAQWTNADQEENQTGTPASDNGSEDNPSDPGSDSPSPGDQPTDPASEDPSNDPSNPDVEPETGEEDKEALEAAVEEAYQEVRKMDTPEALDYGSKLAAIPETEYMKDNDPINVPGQPQAVVAKIADRTTGAEMENGRYSGTKTAGTYSGGEKVDYTITVTNRGTADLHNLVLTDRFAENLEEALDLDSITVDQETTSEKGDKIEVIFRSGKEQEEDQTNSWRMEMAGLKTGDSVRIHLTARIKKGAKAARDLENEVKLTASYQVSKDPKDLEPVPETDEMKDKDKIDIGLPKLTIAKLADRTKGVSLKQGRYQGTKKSGAYKSGDTISYKITASNRGSAAASQVRIEEKPSDQLLNYARIKGFTVKKDDQLKSALGHTIKIEALTRNSITLDKLEAGDSVELTYQLTVQKNKTQVSSLDNLAYIYGKDPSGSDIPQTEEMRDNDRVNLTGTYDSRKNNDPGNKNRTSKTGSAGKTGDQTPIGIWLLILCGAGIGILIMVQRKMKKKE